MNIEWQSPSACSVDEHILNWLLDPSSLTARLKKHCDAFYVEVLGEEIQLCSALEATHDILPGEKVLVREVLLYCDNIPQVFARSLLPLSSLTGQEQQLAKLGNQSLGQVLFNHPNLSRKAIEIAAFDRQSAPAKLAETLALKTQNTLWGRRSTFVLNDKPLMVAEVFLSGSFAYQASLNVNQKVST
jgi:chorismate--pyruvate lyase